ncbi:MAG: hypothetical protein ACPGQS_06260 [Bradymonadia bacterium]
MRMPFRSPLYCLLFLSSILCGQAVSSPMAAGDQVSISVGFESDFGVMRDPGDRSSLMSGGAWGPSLGIQWWYHDWLAIESHFLYQTDSDNLNEYAYESSAWRTTVGVRVQARSVLSPHFAVGLGYDNFTLDWELNPDEGQSQGNGADELSSVVATAELGLSLLYEGWGLSAHIGAVTILNSNSTMALDDWQQGNRDEGLITEASASEWLDDPISGGNFNLGLRIYRSF